MAFKGHLWWPISIGHLWGLDKWDIVTTIRLVPNMNDSNTVLNLMSSIFMVSMTLGCVLPVYLRLGARLKCRCSTRRVHSVGSYLDRPQRQKPLGGLLKNIGLKQKYVATYVRYTEGVWTWVLINSVHRHPKAKLKVWLHWSLNEPK